MRILGIDPGSRFTGFGIIEVDGSHVLSIHQGVIKAGSGEFPERLGIIFRGISDVIDEFRPDEVAVETVFLSKNASSALKLGQARGAVLATLGLCGVPVASHTTSQVKSRVAGHGRAGKEQVAEMVTVLLGLKEHPFEDAADALAVALCHGLDFAPGAPSTPPQPARAGRTKRGSSSRRKGLEALARAQGKL